MWYSNKIQDSWSGHRIKHPNPNGWGYINIAYVWGNKLTNLGPTGSYPFQEREGRSFVTGDGTKKESYYHGRYQLWIWKQQHPYKAVSAVENGPNYDNTIGKIWISSSFSVVDSNLAPLLPCP